MISGNELQILWEVLGAAVLGGVIGLEREYSEKPAGLRTYILIAMSTCLLVNLGTVFLEKLAESNLQDLVTSDPLRTIEAVVVGVSFIGSGLILKNKDENKVKNLTTAALTLFTATIGVSMALQLYVLAVILTVFSLFVAFVLYKLEKNITASREE